MRLNASSLDGSCNRPDAVMYIKPGASYSMPVLLRLALAITFPAVFGKPLTPLPLSDESLMQLDPYTHLLNDTALSRTTDPLPLPSGWTFSISAGPGPSRPNPPVLPFLSICMAALSAMYEASIAGSDVRRGYTAVGYLRSNIVNTASFSIWASAPIRNLPKAAAIWAAAGLIAELGRYVDRRSGLVPRLSFVLQGPDREYTGVIDVASDEDRRKYPRLSFPNVVVQYFEPTLPLNVKDTMAAAIQLFKEVSKKSADAEVPQWVVQFDEGKVRIGALGWSDDERPTWKELAQTLMALLQRFASSREGFIWTRAIVSRGGEQLGRIDVMVKDRSPHEDLKLVAR